MNLKKTTKIDRVILSSDLNPQFINFWPIAASSWKIVFGITPTLVVVSRKSIELNVLKKLEEFGSVYSIISKSTAPMPNQAKMARWYLAGMFENEIVTIEDVDTIYLKSEYLMEKMTHYQDESLLGIGNDVNQDDPDYKGKFPASNLTGKSEAFRLFFNPSNCESFETFLGHFKGLRVFDNREDPFNKPQDFSDESLIRALREIQKNELIRTIPRNVAIQTEWMDRSWWPKNGDIPKQAILANLPRPLYNNQRKCKKLIQLYFQDDYPWIIKRRSNIWENPDNPIRMKVRVFFIVVKNKLSKAINYKKEVF